MISGEDDDLFPVAINSTLLEDAAAVAAVVPAAFVVVVDAATAAAAVGVGCVRTCHQGKSRRKTSATDRRARSISSNMHTSIKMLQPKRMTAKTTSIAIREAPMISASLVCKSPCGR